MDALPPTPTAAVALGTEIHAEMAPAPAAPRAPYAAAEYRPRGKREEELCETASHTDYLYWGGSFALAIGALYANAHWIKFIGYDPDNAGLDKGPSPSPYGPGARLPGPALVGLTWGFFVGGGYLAQPKCSPDWAPGSPPEGDYRTHWHLAVALGLLAGATAPVLDYFTLGGVPQQWPVYERSLRIIVGGASGFVGALLPYLLPPRTWSAAQELRNIRTTVDTKGATLGYTFHF